MRLAARNRVSRGLAVSRVKTSPTRVLRVEVPARMVSSPVVGVVGVTASSFLKEWVTQSSPKGPTQSPMGLGAGAGIEPAAPDNETGMLPLHHPAILPPAWPGDCNTRRSSDRRQDPESCITKRRRYLHEEHPSDPTRQCIPKTWVNNNHSQDHTRDNAHRTSGSSSLMVQYRLTFWAQASCFA